MPLPVGRQPQEAEVVYAVLEAANLVVHHRLFGLLGLQQVRSQEDARVVELAQQPIQRRKDHDVRVEIEQRLVGVALEQLAAGAALHRGTQFHQVVLEDPRPQVLDRQPLDVQDRIERGGRTGQPGGQAIAVPDGTGPADGTASGFRPRPAPWADSSTQHWSVPAWPPQNGLQSVSRRTEFIPFKSIPLRQVENLSHVERNSLRSPLAPKLPLLGQRPAE